MTEVEWQRLYENFEPGDLLMAVDTVDTLRDGFRDRDHGAPPVIRDDLLTLHELALDITNKKLEKGVGSIHARKGVLSQ